MSRNRWHRRQLLIAIQGAAVLVAVVLLALIVILLIELFQRPWGWVSGTLLSLGAAWFVGEVMRRVFRSADPRTRVPAEPFREEPMPGYPPMHTTRPPRVTIHRRMPPHPKVVREVPPGRGGRACTSVRGGLRCELLDCMANDPAYVEAAAPLQLTPLHHVNRPWGRWVWAMNDLERRWDPDPDAVGADREPPEEPDTWVASHEDLS